MLGGLVTRESYNFGSFVLTTYNFHCMPILKSFSILMLMMLLSTITVGHLSIHLCKETWVFSCSDYYTFLEHTIVLIDLRRYFPRPLVVLGDIK